jgi:SagB-type dehydrogenase family enzyme
VTYDLRPALAAAALDQTAVAAAAAVIVVAAVYRRSAGKYGARAERYAVLEAGHAAQNILLEAVALGLAAVPVGAFDDAAVKRALALPQEHEPLYLLAVGRPIDGPRGTAG